MAYFSGSVSARPWPRIDLGFMVIFLCAFSGLAVCLYLAKQPSFLTGAQAAAATKPSIATIPVAVTIDELPAGTWLTPRMFRMELRSIEGMEEQIIRNVEETQGVFTRTTISAGTPLLKAMLGNVGKTSEITERIPSGYRAVAIPVNALTGVEGWVQPGAAVDVVWAIEQNKQLTVSTIVENARVLSVERSLEPATNKQVVSDGSPNHITLLVSTHDAQKIQLAKGGGSLQLSLRGAEDTTTNGSGTLTTESLLSRPAPRPQIYGRVLVDGNEYVLQGNQLIPSEEEKSKDA